VTLEEMKRRLQDLNRSAAGRQFDEAEKREWNRLNAKIDQLEKRKTRLRELAGIRTSHEAGSTVPPQTRRRVAQGPSSESRDEALRAIESRSGELTPEAGDHLTEVVEKDVAGLDSRYIVAISDPAYERAFAKRLIRGEHAAEEFLPEEREAAANVARASEERAMAEGTGSAGGFAVPFTLDPTIQLTSDGKVNPLRRLARNITVVTNEWRGITSAGVAASFSAEAAEVADNSPTLVQPTADVEKAHAFVPFSIELGQDYATLLQELTHVFSDAKDQLEADKYLTGLGHGSNEPQGLLVGAGTVVSTAGTALLQGVYSTQEALGPRYQPGAQWMTSNAEANLIYRTVGYGNTTERPVFNDNRDVLLGKPWNECSPMSAGTVSGGTVAVYGDFKQAYAVVDRIGMNVEVVPHLFGSNRRPTGQRGLYAFWRTTGIVVNSAAFKALKIS
jgi:HK97 family phage major capsid protein